MPVPSKIREPIRDIEAVGFEFRGGKGFRMKKSAQYLKIVEWAEEDQCYVGRCPELMLGGVHGKNEQKVFAELCAVIDEWIAIEALANEINR